MDIAASSMKFVSENQSFSGNLVKDLHHCAYDSLEDFDASDIGDHLTKFLNIKEDEESSDEIKPNSYKDGGSENNHYSQSSNLDTEKCLIKFATFPCSSKSKSPSEFIDRKEERNDDVTADIGVLNNDESSANRLLSHSTSLPVRSNCLCGWCFLHFLLHIILAKDTRNLIKRVVVLERQCSIYLRLVSVGVCISVYFYITTV